MRSLGVLKHYKRNIASRSTRLKVRIKIENIQPKKGVNLSMQKIHKYYTSTTLKPPHTHGTRWSFWVNFLSSTSRAPHKRSNIRAIPRRRSPEENANWISVTACVLCPTKECRDPTVPFWRREVCIDSCKNLHRKVVEVVDFGKLVCSLMIAATSVYINDMHQTNIK